jgi:hypothetical protein
MLIPVGDEARDLTAQIGDRGEGAAADRALRDQAEPALNLVQPGGIGGCVMQVKTRMTCEPCFDFRVFVRAVVIDDQMHVQLLGHFALDVTQESEELLVSMARLTLREHLAIGDIERRKEGGRTVTVVVVRHTLEVAQSQGQYRLRAVRAACCVRWQCFPNPHAPRLLAQAIRLVAASGALQSTKDTL